MVVFIPFNQGTGHFMCFSVYTLCAIVYMIRLRASQPANVVDRAAKLCRETRERSWAVLNSERGVQFPNRTLDGSTTSH